MLPLDKHLHFGVHHISPWTDACCFTSVSFTPRKCAHFARKFTQKRFKNSLLVRLNRNPNRLVLNTKVFSHKL